MKKSIKIFVGLLIISTIIFGIFKLIKSKYTAKIELTTTMWSSWNDRKPKETTTPKEVKINQETGIVTPTMDGGDIYKIKLLEVK